VGEENVVEQVQMSTRGIQRVNGRNRLANNVSVIFFLKKTYRKIEFIK
jgi:hypothetical protein